LKKTTLSNPNTQNPAASLPHRRRNHTLRLSHAFHVRHRLSPASPQAGKPRNTRASWSSLVTRFAYGAFLVTVLSVIFSPTAFATTTTTVWDKANEIMKDVYGQIVLISTIAAIVTASVALLMMNFSRNGRTVDESRAWLKRICITWVVLNGLGFIMAYITPFFADGKWNG